MEGSYRQIRQKHENEDQDEDDDDNSPERFRYRQHGDRPIDQGEDQNEDKERNQEFDHVTFLLPSIDTLPVAQTPDDGRNCRPLTAAAERRRPDPNPSPMTGALVCRP
jgi:hypothetical protein